jgi:hypothetical protein
MTGAGDGEGSGNEVGIRNAARGGDWHGGRAGTAAGTIRDLTPSVAGPDALPAPACDGCSLADAIERKEREARGAAWAGVLVAVLGVMSWTTVGFIGGGVGAVAFGLYARVFAPREHLAALVAGALAFCVLALRLADLI